MTPPTVSLAYRRAALQQASTVGLVIALYDTLAGNLTRAAAALEAGEIETRCRELVHGFKVLQQLDSMLDMKNGGQAALNIRRFYTHLRGQMLAAQFKLDPGLLREQIRIVLDVRSAWQQLDSRGSQSGEAAASTVTAIRSLSTHSAEIAPPAPRQSFSCSG